MKKLLRILFKSADKKSKSHAAGPETGSAVSDFGEAILNIALETVRQDEPANSLLTHGYEIAADLPRSLASSPNDSLIKAWWTQSQIVFSLNSEESRIDVLALEGDPDHLVREARRWTADFKARDYEDLAAYETSIEQNPRPGIKAMFRLTSEYPRRD